MVDKGQAGVLIHLNAPIRKAFTVCKSSLILLEFDLNESLIVLTPLEVCLETRAVIL